MLNLRIGQSPKSTQINVPRILMILQFVASERDCSLSVVINLRCFRGNIKGRQLGQLWRGKHVSRCVRDSANRRDSQSARILSNLVGRENVRPVGPTDIQNAWWNTYSNIGAQQCRACDPFISFWSSGKNMYLLLLSPLLDLRFEWEFHCSTLPTNVP